jgi:hypothetical protein
MAAESNIPVGWGKRKNQMSEHDMKLGGDAATKFATKGIYRNGAETYKSSDEVKAFYMMKIEQAEQQQQEQQQHKEVVVPTGWEDRQKIRDVEAKQYGVFARSQPAPSSAAIGPATNTTTGSTSASSDPTRRGPELALVQLSTNTLDILASTLEQHPISLPMEDRAAFAAALKRAMDAISACR